MREAPLEARSTKGVLFEPEDTQEAESATEEEDDISEDDIQERQGEEDIYKSQDTSHKTSAQSTALTGRNSDDKGKSRSTSAM